MNEWIKTEMKERKKNYNESDNHMHLECKSSKMRTGCFIRTNKYVCVHEADVSTVIHNQLN